MITECRVLVSTVRREVISKMRRAKKLKSNGSSYYTRTEQGATGPPLARGFCEYWGNNPVSSKARESHFPVHRCCVTHVEHAEAFFPAALSP